MRELFDLDSDADRARVGLARIFAPLLVILVGLAGLVWWTGARNPFTPAGYVGYLTKGAIFGKSRFYGTQHGPTSAGRSWLLEVTNVSVTPYTYTEDFINDEAVLSRDNLKISFRVHTVWHIDDQQIPLFMERYSTTVTGHDVSREPDAIVKVAYANYVREPLRTLPATRCSGGTAWK